MLSFALLATCGLASRLNNALPRRVVCGAMYLRKMSPRATCLYSAASTLLRSLSAAS